MELRLEGEEVMEEKKLREIFETTESNLRDLEGDNTLMGLNIIAKYCPKKGVEAAEHDIIYAARIKDVLNAGLTEEDATELAKLNWMIDEYDGFSSFV